MLFYSIFTSKILSHLQYLAQLIKKIPTEYVQYNTSIIFNSLLKGCRIEQASTNCTQRSDIRVTRNSAFLRNW